MPNVIVLEGGAFERCLIHETQFRGEASEGGAFLTATMVVFLQKRPHREPSPLPPHEGPARRLWL